MTTTHTELGDNLRSLSRQHAERATYAATIADVDARDRAAAQLRFVATLADAGQVEVGEAWQAAGEALLAAYAAQDAAWESTPHPLTVHAAAGIL